MENAEILTLNSKKEVEKHNRQTPNKFLND